MNNTYNETDREIVVLNVPRDLIRDLNNIASFYGTETDDLIYSYLVEGIENDSLAVRRMEFTDKANRLLKKNNMPPRTAEDIFSNLVL